MILNSETAITGCNLNMMLLSMNNTVDQRI